MSVYFIAPLGTQSPVKIGHSDVPMSRLRALMTWSPTPLEIIAVVDGGADLERNLHECFARCHSHREWFVPDAAMAEAISKIVAGVPVSQAVDLTVRHPFKRAAFADREAQGKHRSYVARLRAAKARVEKQGRAVRWPDDVLQIMSRWSTCEGLREPQEPTLSELARLDACLLSPSEHLHVLWSAA